MGSVLFAETSEATFLRLSNGDTSEQAIDRFTSLVAYCKHVNNQEALEHYEEVLLFALGTHPLQKARTLSQHK